MSQRESDIREMSNRTKPLATLVGEEGMRRLERVLVRAASGLAATVALAYAVVGWQVGEPRLYLHSIGPALVALVGGLQVATGRERLTVVLGLAAPIIVLQNWLMAGQAVVAAGVLSLAIVGMTGSLFISMRQVRYVVMFSAITMAAGIIWAEGSIGDGLLLGLVSTAAFLFGTTTLLYLRRELNARSTHYQHLFGKAPVSLWEEDFTGVAAWLDGLRASGVTDFESWVAADPTRLIEGAARIEVTDVNEAAIALLEAEDEADLLGHLNTETLTEPAIPSLIPQFLAVWNGEDRAISSVDDGRTLQGNPLHALLYWSAPTVDGKLDLARVTVAIVDITELREAQAHLSNLLRSKDEFVASVSHELRTPLTTVLGLAEELRDDPDRFDTDERSALLRLLADQASEVSTIVEDLLVAAQADTGTVTVSTESVDLHYEVASVLKALGAEEIEIASGDGAGASALADPHRVRQVIRNLIVNARRYGGPNIRVVIAEEQSGAIVEVRDDGTQLPLHQRNAIFDRFFKARQVRGLTASVGLGLAVSRELARLMGGDLVYDHDGAESVFTLTLPRD